MSLLQVPTYVHIDRIQQQIMFGCDDLPIWMNNVMDRYLCKKQGVIDTHNVSLFRLFSGYQLMLLL